MVDPHALAAQQIQQYRALSARSASSSSSSNPKSSSKKTDSAQQTEYTAFRWGVCLNKLNSCVRRIVMSKYRLMVLVTSHFPILFLKWVQFIWKLLQVIQQQFFLSFFLSSFPPH
jgi:hypothetical protein